MSHLPKSTPPPIPQPPPTPLTDRDKYNVVTDTVIGVNVRLGDNVMQAIAVVVGLLIGAGIGALLGRPPGFGAIVGGILGLCGGLLASGIYLMIYRGVRHAKGRHD